MNDLTLTAALATAPSSAFAELRERPRFWFPLLLLVASAAAIAYWYYSIVDIEWFKDLLYANNPDFAKLPEAQRAQMMAMLGRNTMLVTGTLGAMFVMPLILLLQSVYLLLAAKVTKLPQGFRHWFSFSCWAALPALVNVIVAAILLSISDTAQMSPSVTQPLSLNELLLHRPFGDPGYTLLETLTIPNMLSWALMILGVRVWSQRSWAFSATFILLPIVVLYGVWSAFAFR